MKIKEISYKRIKNIGNYENESLEVIAQVEDNEDPNKVFENLKHFVFVKLGLIEIQSPKKKNKRLKDE